VLFRAAGWLAAPEGETLESTHELVTLLVAQLKAHGNETSEQQRLKDQLAYCELSLRNYDDGVSEYWLRYPSDEPHAQKASEYRTYPDYPVAGIYEAGIGIVHLGKDDEATGE
jgi:hypothetical protein